MPVTLTKKGALLLIQGLDISKPAEYIGEQSSPNVLNARVDRGLLVKRYGTSQRGDQISGTDKEIMAGREFKREGVKYNVRIGLDKIEHYNSGTEAWVDITGTDLTGETDDIISTAIPLLSGQPILCITNGIDPIRKWTGSGDTADLGGTPPVAKFIQEYKTYLVCANILGGVDNPQRVQWPDTANPENWTTGNAGAKDLIEDGEDITGLGLFGDYLCIHKKTSIYLGSLVSSSAIFRFDRKATEVGTVADASMVNLPTGEQIFLAEDGLRLFNGISAPLIPSPINEEIRDALNKAKMHKAWGVLVREFDEVWIGVPLGDQETGDTVYKYNYKTGVIHKDLYLNINSAWRATQSFGETWDDDDQPWDEDTTRWNDGLGGEDSARIHLSNSSGYTYISDPLTTNDDGEIINFIWEGKDYESDDLGRLGRWQEANIYAKGTGLLHFDYSIDEGNTWMEASNSPFTLMDMFPMDTSPIKAYFDVISTKFRPRFRLDGLNETVSIKQFVLGVRPREFV